MGISVGDIFGAGGIAGFAKDILDKFVPDPQAKQAAMLKLADNQIELQRMSDDLETKLNDIAGQNIRADAMSGDKFTQRARPTFMYIVEAILAFNYIGIPITKLFGAKVEPITLPGDLLTLFGVCVTGYVLSRTAEKALSIPGESNVSLLGGTIKASNKPTS